eukprot:s1620_g23.t1
MAFMAFMLFMLVHFTAAKCYRRLADLQSSGSHSQIRQPQVAGMADKNAQNVNSIDLMQSVGKPLTLAQAAQEKLQISERFNSPTLFLAFMAFISFMAFMGSLAFMAFMAFMLVHFTVERPKDLQPAGHLRNSSVNNQIT